MFNRLTRLIPLIALLLVPGVSMASEKVVLDPATSSINWTGRKVTGEHKGSVALKSGEVMLENGVVKNGKFGIDVGQVVVKDIEDPTYNAKLTGHLKSPDFFAVEKFPLVEFVIDQATPLKTAGPKGENTQIKGALTIKGISQPVEFPAVVTVKDGMAEAKGTITLDRTKWDIRYGSGKFFQGLGDKLIYDEFEVSFDVKGKVAA